MDHVDPVAITQKVISGVYGGVTTVQLDDLVSLIQFPIHCLLLTTLPGRRDCCLHDRYPPRLRYPRGPYRRFQPSQADQEAMVCSRQRPIPLCQSQEQHPFTHDLQGYI